MLKLKLMLLLTGTMILGTKNLHATDQIDLKTFTVSVITSLTIHDTIKNTFSSKLPTHFEPSKKQKASINNYIKSPKHDKRFSSPRHNFNTH